MIAPRKWVHLLLILSELMLIAAHIILVVMYSKYKKPSWNEKIWMGSKIKTIEKIMNENNNKIYPILEVNDNSNISYNKNYQYLLEHSSRSTCSGNYKKCGILDSMGNIMCIPNEDTCPINNLIIDSRDNQTNNLLSSKFKVSQPPLLRLNNEALYSSNDATDKGIISKIVYSGNTQYYINKDNFVFDEKLYQDYKDSLKTSSSSSNYNYRYSGYKGPSGGWHFPSGGISIRIPTIRIGGGFGGFRRLAGDDKTYGDSTVTSYIEEKFSESKNIDKTFRNISEKINAGYYLGFQDVDAMNKFSNKDFYNLYLERYPNVCSFVFSIILFVAFFILIIFSLKRFCHKDVANEESDGSSVTCGKLMIIIPYSAFYIGFFIYFTYKYSDIYKRKRVGELINIKADPFLEDFLKEVYENIPKESFTIVIIILYIISLCTFICAWILSHHFTKRYMDLLEMTNQLVKN